MNIEEIRAYCLSKHPLVQEGSPFDKLGHPDVAFTIFGKIFAYLCMPDGPSCIHNYTDELIVLKCDPDKAIVLREVFFEMVEPAWHWNKKYWNQVRYSELDTKIIAAMIDHSFNEVVKKLPRKQLSEIEALCTKK